MNRSIFIAFDDFSRAGKYVLSSLAFNDRVASSSPKVNFESHPILSKSATLKTWSWNSHEIIHLSLDTTCVSTLWELTKDLMDWILHLENDLKDTVQSVILIGALYLPVAKSCHSPELDDIFYYQTSCKPNSGERFLQCERISSFESSWKISDPFVCRFFYLLGIEQPTQTQVHGLFAKGYRPGQYPLLEGTRDAISRLIGALTHATARYECFKIDPQVAWKHLEQDATAGWSDKSCKGEQSIYN
ncbi:hypothetical protein ABG067_007245 [Albugo candida]